MERRAEVRRAALAQHTRREEAEPTDLGRGQKATGQESERECGRGRGCRCRCRCRCLCLWLCLGLCLVRLRSVYVSIYEGSEAEP